MRAIPTVRHWMHYLHDETGKLTHFAGHILHERTFWAIVGILALITALFAMLVMSGNDSILEYRYPQYIW